MILSRWDWTDAERSLKRSIDLSPPRGSTPRGSAAPDEVSRTLIGSIATGPRRIADGSDQRRDDDEGIPPAALETVLAAVGHDDERPGPDRSLFRADANGTLAGDDVDDFVTAVVNVARERVAHLQESDRLGRVAGQDRFLERFPANEVSVEKIDNRHRHWRPALRNRQRRRRRGSGLGRRWRRGIQDDVDLAVGAAANRELPLERDESFMLEPHAIQAVFQIGSDRCPRSSRRELCCRGACQQDANVTEAGSVLIPHADAHGT